MSNTFLPIDQDGIQRFVQSSQPAGWYQLGQAAPTLAVLPGIVPPVGCTGMLVQANATFTYCFSPAVALGNPSTALVLQAGGILTISGRSSVQGFCVRLGASGANITFQFLTGQIGPTVTTS